MPSYDYIIIGAGASGLLLADALGKDASFSSKSVLVIEKSSKSNNDRTWCFWEKGVGIFDDIPHKKWPAIHFSGKKIDTHQSIAPYEYKMLRGLDFYNAYLGKIKSYRNITLLHDEVLDFKQDRDHLLVVGKEKSYVGQTVFDSRFDYKKLSKQEKFPVLQQHFVGWFVKTNKEVFNPEEATFMDFSVPQKGNTRFMYVLPFSETKALVEYTLFSENPLNKWEYENAIMDYLNKLGVDSYEILETEEGNIPMSCYDFAAENTDRYLKIGVAGGWAKASTGFTFYNTYKRVGDLVNFIKSGRPISTFDKKNRHWFYDLLLLDILKRKNELGGEIFEALFKKREPQLILKFLDEDTSLWEDLKIIWACPKVPFVKALIKRIF